MLLYLVLGASPANSVFLMSYLFNSSDGVGKQSINERKEVLIKEYVKIKKNIKRNLKNKM